MSKVKVPFAAIDVVVTVNAFAFDTEKNAPTIHANKMLKKFFVVWFIFPPFQ